MINWKRFDSKLNSYGERKELEISLAEGNWKYLDALPLVAIEI